MQVITINNGQNEVNETLKNKKKTSIIPDAIFFTLMSIASYNNLTWQQYIQTTIQYNTQQIYKQVITDIQQQKKLKIDSSEYQNIINNQIRQKVNINNNKISGAVDLQLIGLNNLAKVEGIKSLDNNAKVRFIAVTDESSTDMCQSMNNMEFYVDKENEFDRYWGETKKELRLVRVKVKGLVLGINLAPIMHHWHWCRSWIMYLPVEKGKKIEYNDLDIPRISKEVKQILSNTSLNKNVKRLFDKYLTKENVIIDNNNKKPMYYSENKDKIIINPQHKDFVKYNLPEALSHEIIHMIEKRNKISLNIDMDIMKAQSEIMLDDNKYIQTFKDNRYAKNMTLSDIFSSLTFDNISGKVGHDYDYWYDIDNIKSELSANILSAYINNNQDTLNIINQIKPLKEIKRKVVKEYDRYTR